MPFQMMYVTHPDQECAHRIGKDLLNRKLIACYNLVPIESVYWWEGAICMEGEIVSILKTSLRAGPLVEKAIAEQHPYETPCIIRWEVNANASYEEWVENSLKLD